MPVDDWFRVAPTSVYVMLRLGHGHYIWNSGSRSHAARRSHWLPSEESSSDIGAGGILSEVVVVAAAGNDDIVHLIVERTTSQLAVSPVTRAW